MQNPLWSSSPQHPNARPFFGIVETTVQALRLVHAARLSVIPRIIRRLDDRERNQMVVSGAVFVFSENESGIRRWTDGRLFLSSRIDGNFLVYRELNQRRRGPRNSSHAEEWISMSGDGGREIQSSTQGQYPSRVSFVTENDDGIKVGGLVKRTITVKIHGTDHHVISYYTQEDVDSRRLRPVSSRFDIMNLDLPPQIFSLSDFRFPPRVKTGEDGLSRIVCEPGPFESTSQPASAQTTGYPLARQRHSENHASGSGLALDDAPVPPSVFYNPGPTAALSNNYVPTTSWQEQYNPEQTTAQYSAQDAPWWQAASSEGQIDSRSLTDIFPSTSAYQTQPSHFPYHNPFPMTADTYLSSSQWQDSDGVESNNQTLEQGGHGHT